MHRYKLCIEYDGASFAGFQRQAHLITVQEALERAAYALSGQPTTFYGAGRTDAGVHATGQVVHATFDHAVPLDALRRGINFYLRKKKMGCGRPRSRSGPPHVSCPFFGPLPPL